MIDGLSDIYWGRFSKGLFSQIKNKASPLSLPCLGVVIRRCDLWSCGSLFDHKGRHHSRARDVGIIESFKQWPRARSSSRLSDNRHLFTLDQSH